ncbi:lanthionine synthetase LanC family protein [Granulicella sp. L60]|uniref:lanthionine synthetase LanC family protein n=1 Tax=Granulicella sp. L60 TaxID=1641866 RepID=UPI00131E468E|nr:lanthionine synthetase LanC family protein [Granulicella sp. L60]
MSTRFHSHLLKITRRAFLQTGAVSAIASSSLHSWGEASAPRASVANSNGDFFNGAIEAARWIRSAEKESAQGKYWLPEPDHPEKAVTVSPINGIYSGAAGVVLFFLQLTKATGDPSFLGDARRGADFLVATWQESPAKELLPGTGLSFYTGRAGVAFVLAETWKSTGEAKYRNAALAATQSIAAQAKPAGNGVAWSTSPGIIADGSVILYLLYAARTFNDEQYRALATKAGAYLLELGVPRTEGGVSWKGAPMTALGLSEDTYFPNFELGTAGVAFVLARLYEETGNSSFLDAAKQGALHLQKIATIRGRGALIPYRYPDLTDIYYLGFCHGPAGSARLFYQLYKLTKEDSYLDWTENLARGVIDSGIPANQTPGFWNVVCQCCGSAGLTDFFLGLWAATGKTEYYAFANHLAGQALSHQTNFDDKGYRWYQAWTRVKPWDVSAETGYSIGAAGVGSALLHSSLAQKGKYEAILFPDNPFPATRTETARNAAHEVDFNDLSQFPP